MPKIIEISSIEVKNYLSQKFREILANPNITEAIETSLPYGSGDERTAIIKELMFAIIKI